MILARSSRLLGQIFARAMAAQARRPIDGGRFAREKRIIHRPKFIDYGYEILFLLGYSLFIHRI
jgi:hypothetical protein